MQQEMVGLQQKGEAPDLKDTDYSNEVYAMWPWNPTAGVSL